MDQATVQANVRQQVEAIQNSALCTAFSWRVEVGDLVLFVLMLRRGVASDSYLLRVGLDDYPRRAPSFVFVDKASKTPANQSWPPGVKHNHDRPGICIPGTRECHEIYHANEARYQWDAAQTPVLDTLARIQRLMDRN